MRVVNAEDVLRSHDKTREGLQRGWRLSDRGRCPPLLRRYLSAPDAAVSLSVVDYPKLARSNTLDGLRALYVPMAGSVESVTAKLLLQAFCLA